ncbi:MAG: hypothetical protein LUG57_05020 [Oscillospiraceae bacterium]|nr:hypothetical protein [Oscillospiraceae bacterium]
MDVFSIELAGVPMEIRSRYNYCRWFCRDYLTDRPPVFSVYAEDDRIAELKEFSPELRDEFLERDAIYSAIASRLSALNRVTLHGACISYRGRGYLFAAASGTGKSTHIGLWKQYVGEGVDIVNGDKPIFHVQEGDGQTKITAYDTPWCGKEGWNRKHSAQMGAICFISRSEDGKNHIRPVEPEEAVSLLLRHMFHPYEPEATGRMLELLDKIIETLPLYDLRCDMSEDAVRCSFEALTGERYVSRGIQTTRSEIQKLWRMS